MGMKKIVTFGEILLRWSKNGARRFGQDNAWEGQFGGSEANVAVSLSILGDQVGYDRARLPEEPALLWDRRQRRRPG